jgi:hypothetical protein
MYSERLEPSPVVLSQACVWAGASLVAFLRSHGSIRALYNQEARTVRVIDPHQRVQAREWAQEWLQRYPDLEAWKAHVKSLRP